MVAGIIAGWCAYELSHQVQGYLGLSLGALVVIVMFPVIIGLICGSRVGREVRSILTSAAPSSARVESLAIRMETVFVKLNSLTAPRQ